MNRIKKKMKIIQGETTMRKSLTEYFKDLYGKGNDERISLLFVPWKIFGKIAIEQIKEMMTSKI